MFSLASLLASPLFRKAIATLGIVLLLLGAYQYVYSKGHQAGERDGQRTQLEEDKKAWEADRAKFIETLNSLNDQKKAAEQRADSAESSVEILKAGLNVIHRAIPANAPVPADDATKVKDYPSLFAENEQRKEIIAKQDEQITALKIVVDTQGKQLTAALDQLHRTEVLYAKAYTAAQKKHPLWLKILTVGLVHDRKMDSPPPISQ